MGHVNPTVCPPRKESWRWETTNAEYGKFYVRRNQREITKSQEFQYDCSKKCEELSNELLEAKAQLEKLKISCVRSICGPEGLQDTACQACQASLVTPERPPSRKLYKIEKYNELEGNDNQMLLDHGKEENSHLVRCARPKLPQLKLYNGINNQGDNVGQDNDDEECCKAKMPLGCGVHCGVVGLESRSSSNGSAKDHKPLSIGYGGQGAKTSKGWHSKTSPWMPT